MTDAKCASIVIAGGQERRCRRDAVRAGYCAQHWRIEGHAYDPTEGPTPEQARDYIFGGMGEDAL